MRSLLRFLFAAFTAVILGCSSASVSDGGISETTNGMVARFVNADGTPAAFCRVSVREETAGTVSWAGFDTLTDAAGRVSVEPVPVDRILIEVIGHGATAAVLHGSGLRHRFVDAGIDTLRPFGAVRGVVSGSRTAGMRIECIGTAHAALIDSVTGSFLLDSLPQGVFVVRCISNTARMLPCTPDTVRSIAGSVSVADTLRLLPFARSLQINTTASGLLVDREEFCVPLPVRISGSDIDFSQVRSDGGDIVCTAPSGVRLPCEVALWDSAAGSGILWVLVDTLRPDDSTRSLTFHWGDTAGLSSHLVDPVFDSSAGFAGMWHLDETGDRYALDASSSGSSGTPYAMNSTDVVTGVVGAARRFGSGSYLQMHGSANGLLDIEESSTLVVSLWARVDSVGVGNQVLLSKGNEQYYIKAVPRGDGGFDWTAAVFRSFTGWEISSAPGSVGLWTHILFMRTGTDQRLYVNGLCVDSTPSSIASTREATVGNDLMLGRYIQSVEVPTVQGFCPLNGVLDEVCVMRRLVSSEWAAIFYDTQNPGGGKLLRWR